MPPTSAATGRRVADVDMSAGADTSSTREVPDSAMAAAMDYAVGHSRGKELLRLIRIGEAAPDALFEWALSSAVTRSLTPEGVFKAFCRVVQSELEIPRALVVMPSGAMH